MRAAIHIFVAKGIDGTTIKEIAREAGVAEGALYRHFKSKEELAWHLFSTHLNQFTAELMTRVYPESTAQARIGKFVQECFDAYESDRDLFTYLILREHSELDKFAKTSLHPGHVVLKIVEDGQKSGEIRAGNIFVLAGILIGSVIRICVTKMYGSIPEDLRGFGDEVSASIWAALKREGTQ